MLIRGMEMPENCLKCNLLDWNNGYRCMVTQILVGNILRKGERSEDCPLVEIPTHGRLIDESALLKGCGYIIADGMACIPVKYIANAPTIIPAEEGET
jgi:hypothetical protein